MRTLTQPLNMSPGGIPPVIHVSQYDSDFTIVFTLFSTVGDFTIESGTTAMVRGTKSSGTGYSADAAINISAKTVTVTGNAQMTAAAGQNIFEIVLKKNNKEISSKNFILHVERAALDADTITDESVLKELDAIIEGAETATQAAEEADDAADRAEAAAQSLVIDPMPTQGSAHAVSSGGVYEAIPTIDATLTHSGQAADAKVTGDKIGALKSDLENLEPGLSDEAKAALLNCFAHVAWIDEHGQDYYDELEAALNTYPKIEAVFTPGSSLFYPTDSVDVFKQYLTVKFYETASDTGTTISGSAYTLSGNMYAGINAITVSYEYDGVTYTDAFSAAVGLKWVYPSSAMATLAGGFTRDDTFLDHSNFADTTKSRTKRLYGAADGDLKFHEYYKNGNPSEGIDHTGTVNLYPIPIPSGTTKLTTVFTSSNTSGTTVLQLVKMARSGSNYIANAYSADMSTGDSWTYGSGNDGQYVGIVASNSTEAPVLASLDIVFE